MSTAKGITQRGDKYRAEAYDRATGRRIYKTFPTLSAAKAWRRDMQMKIARGEARAVEPTTIAEAWVLWIERARGGVVRSRGGAEYKPGVLRTYELSMEARVLKRFGRVKVGELRRAAVQRYVDELVAEGLAAQTVRNTIMALRVLMKWCVREELRSGNPCDGLELPSGGGSRDRIAPPAEAVALLAALDDVQDRALMATAFFAGLRRGELMALRWSEVDLAEKRITVEAERGNYCPRTATFGKPKSKAGARTLGIPDLLVPYLKMLLVPIDVPMSGLVFPAPKGGPFDDRVVARRCKAAWAAAELQPIGLHESRHTYASLMIAAGVNIKTISEWMGHSSVTITLDRYGHLLPGSAKEALGLLNAYLTRELS